MAGSVSTDRRQGVNAGAAFKVPVNVATTANIPLLNGLLTVDGVALQEGARVLVWKQTDNLQNGVYNASTGQWRRAIDFDAEFDLHRGSMIWVVAGTTYANTLFQLTTPDNSPDRGPLPDTNALTFAIVTAANTGDIFAIVQNFFTSTDNSIKITNNTTNQTINITNNAPASGQPPFAGQLFEGFVSGGVGLVGSGAPDNTQGNALLQSPTLGTQVSQHQRVRYSSSAATLLAGWYWNVHTAFRGNAVNQGGFQWYCIFSITNAWAADARGLFAMSDGTSVGALNPSAQDHDYFGLGCDSADTNYQIIRMTLGGANFTKFDTGIPKGVANTLCALALSCIPNGSAMRLDFSVSTGFSTINTLSNQSFSTNLPTATTALFPFCGFTSPTVAATSIEFIYSRLVVPYNPPMPYPF